MSLAAKWPSEWVARAESLRREEHLSVRAIGRAMSKELGYHISHNAVSSQLRRAAQQRGEIPPRPSRANPEPCERRAIRRKIRMQRMSGTAVFKMEAEFSGATATRIARAARDRGVEPADLVHQILETVFKDDLVKAVLDD